MIGLLLFAPLQAQQDAVIVRSAKVYAKASSTSQQIGQLDAGVRVSIFTRKGGWKEVFAEQQAVIGWVRSYQVREGIITSESKSTSESDSRGFLSGLAAFSRKASGFFKFDSGRTSSGTATIGVRGLSEDEIKSAVADFEQLEKMHGFASSQKRMQGFAAKGGLRPLQVPHIAGN